MNTEFLRVEYLELVEATRLLYKPPVNDNLPLNLPLFYDSWLLGIELGANPELLFDFGYLLARIAEIYKSRLYDLAQQILSTLVAMAERSSLSPQRLVHALIPCGEAYRRTGLLRLAEATLIRAQSLLDTLSGAGVQRARILYELGYISRKEGNAERAVRYFKQSAQEAACAGDYVGVAIARTLLAQISSEEGRPRKAINVLRHQLAKLIQLSEGEEILGSDRRLFARRWRRNACVSLVEALLDKGLPAELRFVGLPYLMLHSLAHLLITAVSLECGYSASSIRERVYAGQGGYGILLYTGSSGSEGTLGGLVQVGLHLEAHLRAALELGRLCSSDPICAQHRPDDPHEERFLHGAACHGCLLIAEPSCERRNDFLDRALVVPTVEGGGAAFFPEGAA